MPTLAVVLETQLRKIVKNKAELIHKTFTDIITNRDFASEYGYLEEQGDLTPLKKTANYDQNYIGIPSAIELDLQVPNIISNKQETIIGFGRIANLVAMSPQILWYEYGFSESNRSAQGNITNNFAPNFFSGRMYSTNEFYWIESSFLKSFFTKHKFSSFGRFSEGMLFSSDNAILKISGVSAKKSGSIPRVGMYLNSMIELRRKMISIFSGE